MMPTAVAVAGGGEARGAMKQQAEKNRREEERLG